MSILIGKAYSTPDAFEIMSQDIKFMDFKTLNRTITKNLQSYRWPDKASIKYDFDFLSDTNGRTLYATLRNRSAISPGFITIPEPYSEELAKCKLTFAGITNPSTTSHRIDYADTLTDLLPFDGDWTEISTGDYNKIAAYDANFFETEYGIQGQLQFRFNVDSFLTSFSFIDISRLSLIFFGLKTSPLKFYIWDNVNNAWFLMREIQYIDDTDFADPDFRLYYQSVVSFGLPWGYTSFTNFVTNYVTAGNSVHIKVKFPVGTGYTFVQHAYLGINTFHTIHAADESFNYRDSFMGNGKKGSLVLEEM